MKTLGVEHNTKSPAVLAALVDFGSEHSFEEAAKIFQRHYKFSISDSTIRRATEALGIDAEEFISNKLIKFMKSDEDQTQEAVAQEVVFLGFDGCSIRTGKLEEIESANLGDKKRRKRNEEWKDVRLGFVREVSDDAKKWFVGGLKSYPQLMEDLFNLALGKGMNEHTKPVAIADGGIGIYEEADSRFNELQFILDFYHFGKHLYETAEAMCLSKEQSKSWVDHKKNLAWTGETEELKRNLKNEYERTNVDSLRKLLGYVERFQCCISYGKYKELGYPIGSGEVESSHRYITQKRLKIAGACWLKENINPMLALRILKTNNWWDEFWELREKGTKAA